MRALLVVPLFVGACVDMGDRGPAIAGTSADVKIEPGIYGGYRVASPCDSAAANVGVIGTGSVELTDLADLSALAGELGATLRDVPSVFANGYGLTCEPGVGAALFTNDWRDVDAIIVRVGDYLHDHDYAVQVGISVGSIPVAQ